MFCPHCGNQIDDNCLFCDYCKQEFHMNNADDLIRCSSEQNSIFIKIRQEVKSWIIALLVCLALAIGFFVLVVVTLPSEFWMGVLLLLSFAFFYLSYKCFEAWRKWKNDLFLAQNNFVEYEQLCEQRKSDRRKEYVKERKQWEINHPTCPVCFSRNTYRISDVNRATSIAVWGLASSKIGKQYACNQCKHKW